MEKRLSLKLEDYKPAETRIYRVLTGELPDDFTDKYAKASVSVNEAMCEAFEKKTLAVRQFAMFRNTPHWSSTSM